jgi:large subunit ribosomal protein L23
MVRTPGLSPYHARFLVPLDFSKYDLRDYLYHAYNVKSFNIRSYLKHMPVRDTNANQRSWFRVDQEALGHWRFQEGGPWERCEI